jgi:hypothetical protein
MGIGTLIGIPHAVVAHPTLRAHRPMGSEESMPRDASLSSRGKLRAAKAPSWVSWLEVLVQSPLPPLARSLSTPYLPPYPSLNPSSPNTASLCQRILRIVQHLRVREQRYQVLSFTLSKVLTLCIQVWCGPYRPPKPGNALCLDNETLSSNHGSPQTAL